MQSNVEDEIILHRLTVCRWYGDTTPSRGRRIGGTIRRLIRGHSTPEGGHAWDTHECSPDAGRQAVDNPIQSPAVTQF
jgi:hypothetical protein